MRSQVMRGSSPGTCSVVLYLGEDEANALAELAAHQGESRNGFGSSRGENPAAPRGRWRILEEGFAEQLQCGQV